MGSSVPPTLKLMGGGGALVALGNDEGKDSDGNKHS